MKWKVCTPINVGIPYMLYFQILIPRNEKIDLKMIDVNIHKS